MIYPVFKECENADVLTLIADMREIDRREIELGSPELSIEQAVWASVQLADVCYAVYYAGELMCICGAGLVNLRENRAVIWALGTVMMEARPRPVVRFSRGVLLRVLNAMPVRVETGNIVWDGNAAALRWLKHLGAEFVYSIYMRGENFTVFRLPKLKGGI